MRRLIAIVSLAVLWQGDTLLAQLAPVNELGVTWGHLHLTAPDLDKETKAWLALGGQLGNNLNPANIPIAFPGIVVLMHQGEISGGSAGSLVDHVAFRVPNFQASMMKWRGPRVAGKEANWGLKTESGSRPGQGFVTTPAQVKIEILEDKTLTVPIVFDHAHFFVPESSLQEIEAYYTKMYGAQPVKGESDSFNLPGGKLMFSKTGAPSLPTKGRSLDHIGFNAESAAALVGFQKGLEAKGAKFERTYVMGTTRAANVLDGFGMVVELTKGFSAFFDPAYPTDEYLK